MTMVIDARPQTATTPRRMVPKFVNGIWTVFDREFYDHGPSLPLERRAIEIAADLQANLPPKKVVHRARR